MTALALGFILVSALLLAAGKKEIPENSLSQTLSSSSLTSLLPDFFLYRQKQLRDCIDDNCLTEKLKSKPTYHKTYDEIPTYGQPVEYDWPKANNVIDMENELINKRTRSYNDNSFNQCGCTKKFDIVDLGKTHHPRFHRTAICRGTCRYGSKCEEVSYNILVLTNHSDVVSLNDPLYTQVPDNLQDKWKFESHAINVSCECVNMF